MTTNERLWAAKLLEEFHAAMRNRDRTRMIGLLSQVELEDQAASIVDIMLADPDKYDPDK